MEYFSKTSQLKGVGPKKEEELAKLGLKNILDVLFHFPFRYEDWRTLPPIGSIAENEDILFLGQIEAVDERRSDSGVYLTTAYARGEQGEAELIWFNQRWVKNNLRQGETYLFFGKKNNHYDYSIRVSQYLRIYREQELSDYLRLQPIYPAGGKLKSRDLKILVEQVLAFKKTYPLPELLRKAVRENYGLFSLNEAVDKLHHPENFEEVEKARKSFVIYEFLAFLGWMNQEKENITKKHQLEKADQLFKNLKNALPFALTGAQERAVLEIKKDMESPYAMRRLLQGDVGSGKTLVSLYPLLKAVESGGQGALLAPTEILAQQHYEKIKKLLADEPITLGFLSGKVKGKEREAILEKLQCGEIQLIIGTHALLEPTVLFKNLFVAVIDEQHRFGVNQRNALMEKAEGVDVLVMTATPIPRSLALTVYGDLDLTVIDELPPNRQVIDTHWMTERSRRGLYGFLHEHIKSGEQVYVVCPLISESEVLDLKNAEALAEQLQYVYLQDCRVALLHGKMTSEEKDEIMRAFGAHQLDVLVSTTVIEVGIDVPNATIMVIEDAERFGLAQLHQLRGRVGRGKKKSYCFLVCNAENPEAKQRMGIMVKYSDGFKISQEDLKMRGPGEFLGVRQHGLPALRLADFATDSEELDIALSLIRGREVDFQHRDFFNHYLNHLTGV